MYLVITRIQRGSKTPLLSFACMDSNNYNTRAKILIVYENFEFSSKSAFIASAGQHIKCFGTIIKINDT